MNLPSTYEYAPRRNPLAANPWKMDKMCSYPLILQSLTTSLVKKKL